MLVFEKQLPLYDVKLASDVAGNVYAVAPTYSGAMRVKNSIASCPTTGSASYLTILAPNGEVLQSTYLPLRPGFAVTSTHVVSANRADKGVELQLARLSPSAAAPVLTLACVANAASLELLPVTSPCEIVSAFGEGLRGARLTVAGKPAPVLYSDDQQINAIVPRSVPDSGPVEVCAVVNGGSTNCLRRDVVAASPGVFTLDGNYAAASNQDGTPNSPTNPAAPGSIVSIFATGLGPVDPMPADGAITDKPAAHRLPTKVGFVTTLNGFMTSISSVSYSTPVSAGPAPLQVSGLSQVQVRATAIQMLVSVEGHNSNRFRIHVAPDLQR